MSVETLQHDVLESIAQFDQKPVPELLALLQRQDSDTRFVALAIKNQVERGMSLAPDQVEQLKRYIAKPLDVDGAAYAVVALGIQSDRDSEHGAELKDYFMQLIEGRTISPMIKKAAMNAMIEGRPSEKFVKYIVAKAKGGPVENFTGKFSPQTKHARGILETLENRGIVPRKERERRDLTR